MLAVSHLKTPGGDPAQETAERLVLRHADHEVIVARHADVGHERRPAGKDTVIGRRRMGMGADHRSHRPSIKWPIACFSLVASACMSMMMASASRLSGQIDELARDRRERIVERVHEDAAHGVDDQHLGAVARLEQRGAAAGRSIRIVERTDELWRALDEDQRLFLVPGVVAERDRVGAGVDEVPDRSPR